MGAWCSRRDSHHVLRNIEVIATESHRTTRKVPIVDKHHLGEPQLTSEGDRRENDENGDVSHEPPFRLPVLLPLRK